MSQRRRGDEQHSSDKHVFHLAFHYHRKEIPLRAKMLQSRFDGHRNTLRTRKNAHAPGERHAGFLKAFPLGSSISWDIEIQNFSDFCCAMAWCDQYSRLSKYLQAVFSTSLSKAIKKVVTKCQLDDFSFAATTHAEGYTRPKLEAMGELEKWPKINHSTGHYFADAAVSLSFATADLKLKKKYAAINKIFTNPYLRRFYSRMS